ncbi:hypothetical protein BVY01_01675 [bacterium I07]|nr:hypothetical protein BVY01_01675 [bacterium I07]
MDHPEQYKYHHITILGGGLAGLSAGYFAAKRNIPVTIFEASSEMGGNCKTFQYKGFSFDSGAHRLHHGDPEINREIRNLLGDDIQKLDIPSNIYHAGKWIHFPLMPMNLLRNMGLKFVTNTALEILFSRLKSKQQLDNFQEFALYKYGKSLSERFLLNYSEKLWGISCDRLSRDIAGKRLKGFYLKAFLWEAFFGSKASKHVEGIFYYPRYGIGQLIESMKAAFSSSETCHTNSAVTRIFHRENKIIAIEINDTERIETEEIVSTLPVNRFLTIMDPAVPEAVLKVALQLHYQNILLVAFIINKKFVTKVATIYFPESAYPFTRIYEPKNRSPFMAPANMTSLVMEIPCSSDDVLWKMSKQEVVETVLGDLLQTGLITRNCIVDTTMHKLEYAYPVLELNYKHAISKINAYLSRFKNLAVSGRNAKFAYSWIHDEMQASKAIINGYRAQ